MVYPDSAAWAENEPLSCGMPAPAPAASENRTSQQSRASSGCTMAMLVGPAAALVVLCLVVGLEASPELSGYLRKVLRNHTTHTCDGEQLLIVCPHKTTISILGAFYGRRVPSPNLCPSPGNASQESTQCSSTTAHLKLQDECQDQQWCQFSVHSQVFGLDPCPGTHKYLIASYKCRPGNHRVKTVCENNKLKLQCRPKSVLAIYSANYGRFLRGKPECDALNTGAPHIECLAPDALRRVSKKCHRKMNCTVAADQATFGDPCLPGMKKQLRVSYTCVPKQLLEEVGPDTSDPFLLSDYMHGGWYKGPRFSKLREDRMIFTSSLEVFAHLWGTCPHQLSCSTQGSGMDLGGWLRSCDSPYSPKVWLRGSQTPPAGTKVRTAGTHAGLRGGSEVEQASRSLCCCSSAHRSSVSVTHWVSFLPALSAGALTASTSAGKHLPYQGKLVWDDSSHRAAYPASHCMFPMGQGAFWDTGGCW
ncbi:protein eva-1 homolog C-like isoform X4 [Heliangelus exortis]|uniref:protein eva-1 homolog C-like isoform X4 n=1 Tax=Heliangelus exortis TaxID=472823 RepID=UPI003A908349